MDSPRSVAEVDLIRATPTSWLALLELEEQSPNSRVTFLFERCKKLTSADNAVVDRIVSLRRIRAFIELADKRVVKTSGFCMTRTEAIETAAYEFLRLKMLDETAVTEMMRVQTPDNLIDSPRRISVPHSRSSSSSSSLVVSRENTPRDK